MSGLALVGWAAAAVLVALWLAISLTAPSRRRETLEWLAAASLYVAPGITSQASRSAAC